MGFTGILMAYYGGLQGIRSGLTESIDHQIVERLPSVVQAYSVICSVDCMLAMRMHVFAC